MANDIISSAEELQSLAPDKADLPNKNSMDNLFAAQEHDARVEDEFINQNRESNRDGVSGLAAFGAGASTLLTSPSSPIRAGLVGAAKGIDLGISLADKYFGNHNVGPEAEQRIHKHAQTMADLGWAQSTSKFLDLAREKANNTLNVAPGLLNRSLYFGGWLAGEAAEFSLIGRLGGEALAVGGSKITGVAEKLGSRFLGKVVSPELAKATSQAVLKAVGRGVGYGTAYTGIEALNDILSGDVKEKSLGEYLHSWLGNTMAIAGFELAPWGLGVAVPAAYKAGKKIWDGFNVNLMTPSESAKVAQKWFDTSGKTNVNNGIPYVKAAIGANIKKLPLETITKLKWHAKDYTIKNDEIAKRQDNIIKDLGEASGEELHNVSHQDLLVAAQIFKVLKDNSPAKYERWNTYDLENNINKSLPDHGAYKVVKKSLQGEGWDLSPEEEKIRTRSEEALSSPIKEADYIKKTYLSRPESLSPENAERMKARHEALKESENESYDHPVSKLVKELIDSEDEYRQNSKQLSGIDAILNGNWEQEGVDFENAITSTYHDMSTPPEEPSYDEQIAAETSREVQEETSTPIPDEEGAIDEAKSTELSNLAEEERAEFKDKVDSLERQENNHESYTGLLDKTVSCVTKNMYGG